jgi:hypothetical protein
MCRTRLRALLQVDTFALFQQDKEQYKTVSDQLHQGVMYKEIDLNVATAAFNAALTAAEDLTGHQKIHISSSERYVKQADLLQQVGCRLLKCFCAGFARN